VNRVIILGASARAAAFSALRAGWQPWCVDLFADADLQSRCPVERLRGRYPQGFVEALEHAPHAPFFYTGGLENWPDLVHQLSRRRPLWGNPAEVLRQVRRPETIYQLLSAAGLPVPRIASDRPEPGPVRWLSKPRRGAGGNGVRFIEETAPPSRKSGQVYFQEYIGGAPMAALYLAEGQQARLLGLTRQLVSEPWLHASPFHYCGSLGPVHPGARLRENLERIGNTLTAGCQLRGVFGVDGVLRDGNFWPVEVNPRYTASVEVLEYALGAGLLPGPQGKRANVEMGTEATVGKAILFARQRLTFPCAGPWSETLLHPPAIDVLPRFADIPSFGETIEAGRPILTFFAQAASEVECLVRLVAVAQELERVLYR
jgi:uncharacterized protein